MQSGIIGELWVHVNTGYASCRLRSGVRGIGCGSFRTQKLQFVLGTRSQRY